MQDLNGVLCDFGTVKPAAGAENDSRFSFGYADPFYVAHGKDTFCCRYLLDVFFNLKNIMLSMIICRYSLRRG